MPTADNAVRSTLFRLTVVPGWFVLGATSLVFVLGVSIPLRYQFVPLVASVLVFGLPHGAVDHLAPSRVRGEHTTLSAMGRVGLLYAVLMSLYALVWFLTPVVAFVLFILLTWAHWGQGEIHALATIGGVSSLRTPAHRALTAIGRGALPMLVPLVAFPDQYRFVAETLVGLFAGPDLGSLSVAFSVRGRAVVAFVLAAVLICSLALGYHRRSDDREWFLDTGETVLLVVFFLTVPPILAVGLYFSFWHALRHVGRLLAIDPGARHALSNRRYARALGRFFRDAMPLTLASLGIVAGSYALVPATPVGLAGLVGLYLVVIAVLTLPHVVVVTYLDAQQRVWTTERIQLT